MEIVLLILQAATLGVLVYVILQIKTIFREVRTPVVRQKGSLSAEFKDRLRNLPRPEVNRDNRDNRSDRGPRPEGDRPRGDRPDRGPRPEGDRPRGDRPDRGPRPEFNRENRGPRPESSAPVSESAPAVSEAPAAAPAAAAPSFQGGRRPLNASSAPVSSDSSVDATPEGLAPSSLAQPVSSDAPIRHGRRTLPKVKPRFDDEGDDSSEEKKEAPSA